MPTPITELLDHLGLDLVHVAVRMADDLLALTADGGSERVRSLTVISPNSVPVAEVAGFGARATMVASDRPMFGDLVAAAKTELPDTTLIALPDYQSHLWADLAADHTGLLQQTLLDQRDRWPAGDWTAETTGDIESGTVAGVSYRIVGKGQPLLLLPLGLAPSAWQPLVDELSKDFRVIVAGGAELGVIPMLEDRGRSDGYRAMMSQLFRWIEPAPGESILEVGCGTGVVMRWLHQETGGQNPISGVDLNHYLLGEAKDLATAAGLGDGLQFSPGNAEALPFDDASFDVTFCTTVMEEVDATKMLDELVRVTKPGGRVGVVVRATDMPLTLNLPLPREELLRLTKLPVRSEAPGCATASLYGRMPMAGLVELRNGPYLANFSNPAGHIERYVIAGLLGRLGNDSAAQWRDAIRAAERDGTFLLSWPHHLAVGTKPC